MGNDPATLRVTHPQRQGRQAFEHYERKARGHGKVLDLRCAMAPGPALHHSRRELCGAVLWDRATNSMAVLACPLVPKV